MNQSTPPSQQDGKSNAPQQQSQQNLKSKAKSKPNKQRNSKPQNPGFVPILRSLASDTRTEVKTERTYYHVNVLSIIAFAVSFATFLRRSYRRPNWRTQAYYVGMIVRAFMIKLQRVAIETHQLDFNRREMISSFEFTFVASVVYAIDTFGVFTDSNGVIVAPLVTMGLLQYLARIYLNCNSDNEAIRDLIIEPQNHRAHIRISYGDLAYENVVIAYITQFLEVPHSPSHVRYHLNRSFTLGLSYARSLIQPHPPNIPDDITNVLLRTDQQHIILETYFAPGSAPPPPDGTGIGGLMIEPLNANINATRLVLCPAQLPFVEGLPDLTEVATPYSPELFTFECESLQRLFLCSPVSVSPTGSPAPLVLAQDTEFDVSGSSAIACTEPKDWVIGCSLQHSAYLCYRNGIPFNVTSNYRRTCRFFCLGLGVSARELVSTIWRESVFTQRR